MLTDIDLEKIGTLVEAIVDNRLETRLKPLEERLSSMEKRFSMLENEFYSFRADMTALYLSHDQRIYVLETGLMN